VGDRLRRRPEPRRHAPRDRRAVRRRSPHARHLSRHEPRARRRVQDGLPRHDGPHHRLHRHRSRGARALRAVARGPDRPAWRRRRDGPTVLLAAPDRRRPSCGLVVDLSPPLRVAPELRCARHRDRLQVLQARDRERRRPGHDERWLVLGYGGDGARDARRPRRPRDAGAVRAALRQGVDRAAGSRLDRLPSSAPPLPPHGGLHARRRVADLLDRGRLRPRHARALSRAVRAPLRGRRGAHPGRGERRGRLLRDGAAPSRSA
jgi:hypothetical protein